MKNITCEIVRHVAVLSEERSGWKLELNEVAWNGNAPKLEIRRWGPDHEKSGKGVTLTEKEARTLLSALREELSA